ncbi:MAG: tetratricopeptide repeat protein [Pseudanabaenaceae cyanobacterium bins.39]|nr:tetratricopeptide repeat protein [Pseudanabaenaceae cyanobacterium bins.39]
MDKICNVVILSLLFAAPMQILAVEMTQAQQSSSSRRLEADRLLDQAMETRRMRDYQAAVQFDLQALSICRELRDVQCESFALNGLGISHDRLGLYPQAITYHQQSLAIFRQLGNRQAESSALNNLGLAYDGLKQFARAIEFYEQSLLIKRQLGDRRGEANTLRSLGNAYGGLELSSQNTEKAINAHQQSLTIFKQLGDRYGEAAAINNLGSIYYRLGQFAKALEFNEQSLVIFRQLGDRFNEGKSLFNLGNAYNRLAQHEQAIKVYQQAIAIFQREQNLDLYIEGDTWRYLGDAYRSVGQYQKSLDAYTQSLAFFTKMGDRSSIKDVLNDLGTANVIIGQYQKALNFYQRSLAIAKQTQDREGEANALIGIGNSYSNLGQYAKSLEFYQQALVLKQQTEDRQGQAKLLGNLASVYDGLGNYGKAIDFNQQSIALFEKIGDREGVGKSLNNLGSAYSKLGEYTKAISSHEQSLAISQQLRYAEGESRSFNNLGNIYRNLGQLPKAIAMYQKSLEISKGNGNQQGQANSLGNLGNAHISLKQYQQAANYYQQALGIFQRIGDRQGQGISYNNLGYTLAQLQQTELAILAYKQSINVRETIRKDIKELSKEDQASYLNTVASSYRSLADLLLKQGRVMEALQVLDLLKVQELEDYLKNIKGSDRSAQGVKMWPVEQNLAQQLTTAPLENLDTISNLNRQLANQIQQLPATELNRVPEYLKQIPQGTVLLYPLILSDRLEIILFSTNSLPIRKTVNIRQTQLEAQVTEFKANLIDEGSEDYQDSAIALYNLIIKPIEADLNNAKAQTILYASDGILRYIPLAALNDGKQWVAEKYRISNLIAYTLSDFTPKAKIQPNILAGAFGGKSGERRFGQIGLPATLQEAQAIAKTFPQSTTLLEEQFSRQATEAQFNNHNILHFATHAEFNTGVPDNSFIIFGNGDKIRLSELTDWQIPNVELMVLSACQTGVGKLGTGVEILGFGYQVQKIGVKNAIASLWSVDDVGTQALMESFYKELQKNDVNAAEALHRAQISLIRSDKFRHPKYWSAFFAIGNRL